VEINDRNHYHTGMNTAEKPSKIEIVPEMK